MADISSWWDNQVSSVGGVSTGGNGNWAGVGSGDAGGTAATSKVSAAPAFQPSQYQFQGNPTSGYQAPQYNPTIPQQSSGNIVSQQPVNTQQPAETSVGSPTANQILKGGDTAPSLTPPVITPPSDSGQTPALSPGEETVAAPVTAPQVSTPATTPLQEVSQPQQPAPDPQPESPVDTAYRAELNKPAPQRNTTLMSTLENSGQLSPSLHAHSNDIAEHEAKIGLEVGKQAAEKKRIEADVAAGKPGAEKELREKQEEALRPDTDKFSLGRFLLSGLVGDKAGQQAEWNKLDMLSRVEHATDENGNATHLRYSAIDGRLLGGYSTQDEVDEKGNKTGNRVGKQMTQAELLPFTPQRAQATYDRVQTAMQPLLEKRRLIEAMPNLTPEQKQGMLQKEGVSDSQLAQYQKDVEHVARYGTPTKNIIDAQSAAQSNPNNINWGGSGTKQPPVSVRQNNPLNLTGPDGKIRSFNSFEEGRDAGLRDLAGKIMGTSPAYKAKFGDAPVTPARLAEVWSPAAAPGNSPESTKNYGLAIAKSLGISPDQEIPKTSDSVNKAFGAMQQFEAGTGSGNVNGSTPRAEAGTSGAQGGQINLGSTSANTAGTPGNNQDQWKIGDKEIQTAITTAEQGKDYATLQALQNPGTRSDIERWSNRVLTNDRSLSDVPENIRNVVERVVESKDPEFNAGAQAQRVAEKQEYFSTKPGTAGSIINAAKHVSTVFKDIDPLMQEVTKDNPNAQEITRLLQSYGINYAGNAPKEYALNLIMQNLNGELLKLQTGGVITAESYNKMRSDWSSATPANIKAMKAAIDESISSRMDILHSNWQEMHGNDREFKGRFAGTPLEKDWFDKDGNYTGNPNSLRNPSVVQELKGRSSTPLENAENFLTGGFNAVSHLVGEQNPIATIAEIAAGKHYLANPILDYIKSKGPIPAKPLTALQEALQANKPSVPKSSLLGKGGAALGALGLAQELFTTSDEDKAALKEMEQNHTTLKDWTKGKLGLK